ncbi:MAG: hypothetical protein L3J47_00575 [Sulfurovum sp.]|nr:hypothetical protein [Sulfurovum sp.]
MFTGAGKAPLPTGTDQSGSSGVKCGQCGNYHKQGSICSYTKSFEDELAMFLKGGTKHAPAGTSTGGQFTSGSTGGSSVEEGTVAGGGASGNADVDAVPNGNAESFSDMQDFASQMSPAMQIGMAGSSEFQYVPPTDNNFVHRDDGIQYGQSIPYAGQQAPLRAPTQPQMAMQPGMQAPQPQVTSAQQKPMFESANTDPSEFDSEYSPGLQGGVMQQIQRSVLGLLDILKANDRHEVAGAANGIGGRFAESSSPHTSSPAVHSGANGPGDGDGKKTSSDSISVSTTEGPKDTRSAKEQSAEDQHNSPEGQVTASKKYNKTHKDALAIGMTPSEAHVAASQASGLASYQVPKNPQASTARADEDHFDKLVGQTKKDQQRSDDKLSATAAKDKVKADKASAKEQVAADKHNSPTGQLKAAKKYNKTYDDAISVGMSPTEAHNVASDNSGLPSKEGTDFQTPKQQKAKASQEKKDALESKRLGKESDRAKAAQDRKNAAQEKASAREQASADKVQAKADKASAKEKDAADHFNSPEGQLKAAKKYNKTYDDAVSVGMSSTEAHSAASQSSGMPSKEGTDFQTPKQQRASNKEAASQQKLEAKEAAGKEKQMAGYLKAREQAKQAKLRGQGKMDAQQRAVNSGRASPGGLGSMYGAGAAMGSSLTSDTGTVAPAASFVAGRSHQLLNPNKRATNKSLNLGIESLLWN